MKVWNNISGVTHLHRVATEDEAKALIRKLTAEQVNDGSIAFNAFGLLDENGDEWDNGQGDDISAVIDAEDNNEIL